MPETIVVQQIAALFRRTPVTQMADLERAVGPRSRRSLFRDLAALSYLSSYTHTGRYYTLASVPEFDADGLWCWQSIGFSRDGTLMATVRRLVDTSEAGRTQHELQSRLGVRVHNPLLALVSDKQLAREPTEREYVYLAAERARAMVQLERRRALTGEGAVSTPLSAAFEVEVLLEVIHGARVPRSDAALVAARLETRGVRAPVAQVSAVLERYGLGKKRQRRLALRARRVEATGCGHARGTATRSALDRGSCGVRRRSARSVPALQRANERAEDGLAARHHLGARAVHRSRDGARLCSALPRARSTGHTPCGIMRDVGSRTHFSSKR